MQNEHFGIRLFVASKRVCSCSGRTCNVKITENTVRFLDIVTSMD
jgi:hypothetical protein